MALEVGGVVARLGARLDDAGFDRFDRRLEKARRDATRGVDAKLGTKADTSGIDRYDRKLRDVERGHERVGAGMSKTFGIAAVARYGAATAGVASIGIALTKAGGMAIGFQKTMAEVGAVTGASKKDLDRLADAAINMGTKTGLGAGKAAQAITELAKGGLTTDQILRGGLAGAMSLAAAGGLELADAASATANALNLFHLQGSQATHVADAFATAANATTADVSDFALALSQGGAAAKAAGLTFDQTTVALEALAANGVKGSDAGTSLKSALTQIASPTKQSAEVMEELGLKFFDAHGNMKDLSDISGMLQDKLGGMTKQQRLQVASTVAGTDGMRALLALYDTGPRKLDAFAHGLEKHGTAAEVAAKKQDNFAGGMGKLSAAFEGISARIGQKVLPALGDFAAGLAGLISGQGGGGGVEGARKAIGGLFDGITGNESVRRTVDAIVATFERLWNAAKEVGRGIGEAFAGSGPSFAAIGRAIAKVQSVIAGFNESVVRKALPGVVQAFKGLAQIIRGVVDVIAGILTLDFGKAWDGVERIFGGAIRVIAGLLRAATAPLRASAEIAFKVIGRIANGVWDAIVGGARKALDLILGYFTTLAGAWSSVLSALSHVPGFGWAKDAAKQIDAARDSIDRFRESLRKTTREAPPMTKAISEAGGRATELRERMKHLKKGTDEYRTTARELRRAQRDLNAAIRDGDGAGRKGARGINKLGSAAGSADDAVATAAANIAANVNNLASSLGAKGIKFTPAKTAGGRRRQSNTFGDIGDFDTGGLTRATGGWVGSRGQAGGDTVPAMLGLGEVVLNRHQQPLVEAALDAVYGIDLDDLFGAVQRPHYLAGGGRIRGFAAGGRYGFGDLERLWKSVGGSPAADATAAAVALAESAGDPNASNVNTNGSIDRGLWQINSVHGAQSTFDITGNARAAVSISGNGRNWNPWTTFKSGAYRRFLGGHAPGGGGGGGAGPRLPGIGIAGPAGALSRLANAATGKLHAAGQAYLDRHAPTGGGGGGALGAPGGGGLGTFDGLPVANWIIPILNWARAHGWRGHLTSGYRSHAHNVAQGRLYHSNHEDTAYPGGAIDVGGYGARAEGSALADVLARYSGARRLVWGGPAIGDWGHFSATGHARGGRAGFAPGGRVGGKRKHPFRPSVLGGAKSYIRNMAPLFSDTNHDYEAAKTKVDDLNVRYGVTERRYDLSEEELVDEDGNVDAGAIKARANELLGLERIRKQIVTQLRKALAAVNRAIASYKQTIRLLQASLAAAKGKERSGVRALLGTYRGRLAEWQGHRKELRNDLIPNAKLDVDALDKERLAVLGTVGRPADTSGGDTGDTGDSFGFDDSGTLDTFDDTGGGEVQLPPTPEQIAAGVAEAFQSFNAARADLFGQYGANFMRAGDFARAVAGGATPTELGAGARYFGGGTGGMDGGALEAAGGLTVVQQISFAGPQPADPHTFTQAALHELKAAV